MRLRNVRGSREQIAASPLCIKEAQKNRGNWKGFFGDGRPLHIEIGMGKGRFLMEMAENNPQIHYIGIEKFSSVLVRAIQRVEEMDNPPQNIHFLRMDAEYIEEVFGPGEVERIYLNFSDPWPKERHVKRRLTSGQFLKRYENILSPEGLVIFKTDNKDLFEFSVAMAEEAGWTREVVTRDLHHSPYLRGNVMTEYEERFVARGNPICMMKIRPGRATIKPDRLCAIDLDGTLMRSDSRVSDYSKKVLVRAIRRGIEFLPTSGRSYRAAAEAISGIEGTRYFLGGNASVITEVASEKVIRQWIIPQEAAYRIYRIVKDNGGYIEMYCENDVYTERGSETIAYQAGLDPTFIDSLLETVIRVPSMDLMLRRGIMQVNKMHIIFPKVEDRDHYAAQFARYPEVNVVFPTERNMEVFSSDCNKDVGMEYIRAMLDIKRENTIAIGDSNNDRAMIDYAACGVAVANAMEELKSAADLVIEGNDQDGPARFLEKLMDEDVR